MPSGWEPTGLQIDPDDSGLKAGASLWSSTEASDETLGATGDISFLGRDCDRGWPS